MKSSRLLIKLAFSFVILISLLSTSYSLNTLSCNPSNEEKICKINNQNTQSKKSNHIKLIDTILIIGVIILISPYIFPFIVSGVFGGYKSGWDAALGGAFGGSLGGGFGGFSGGSKDANW